MDLPRFPSISPDGREVVFSWRGDLWRVGVGGGEAVRLTAHPAIEKASAWSPDGAWIAFESSFGFQEWLLYATLALGAIALAYFSPALYGFAPWAAMATSSAAVSGTRISMGGDDGGMCKGPDCAMRNDVT